MINAAQRLFARRRARRHACLLSLAALTCSGCGDDDTQPASCSSAQLETDLESTPFMGAGVDGAGQLKLEPGHKYVVSTTYGVPNPGPDGNPVPDTYIQAFAAIQEQLAKQTGLVAYQLASSAECGSGRTLAVWESEDAMYEFVTSPAHLDAMTSANRLLKPGYAVTHYDASRADHLTFAVGVQHIAAEVER